MDKVAIERLPNTKEVDGAKRWIEDKGEFAHIFHMEDIRHVAWFELKKGYFRGGHFHEMKKETFYVIDGVMRGIFIDLHSFEREEHLLIKGDKVKVAPDCAHILYGIEDSHAVEYSDRYYNKEDTFPYEF